jgi:hypothetical protein
MQRTIALLVLLAASQAAAAADVGRVLLAGGSAVAIRGNQTVALARDSVIQEKDLLRTGPGGSLQVRFSDESLLSLRENSELSVDSYRFQGREDGSELAVFRLVKGGLRTITGLIGRSNHSNYRMQSITSTIGIRGTDYAATLCQGDCRNSDGSLARDGLYGRVIGQSGGTNRIVVSNDNFERMFGINQNFYVADARSEPQQLLEPPTFVSTRPASRGQTAGKGKEGSTGNEGTSAGGSSQDSRGTTTTTTPAEPPAFVATEQRNASGAPALVPSTPLGIAGSDGKGGGGAFIFSNQLTLSGTTVIGINITGNDFDGSSSTFSGTTTLSAVTDIGSSSEVSAYWGRWTSGSMNDNGTAYTLGVAPNGHFHYIYGSLTPPDVIASKTGTATFTRIGGTTPTDSVSAVNTASMFSFGTIGVDFTARTASLTSLVMQFPTGVNYNFSNVPLQIKVQTSGATLEGNFTNPTGCTGGACITSSPATLKVNGAFVGPTGNHIGAVFSTTSTPAGSTSSAQLFKCAACP